MITEVERLRELENLEALCSLYFYTELLMLPNLVTFTKLKRLCISHSHKLAMALLRENVLENVEAFHSLGDKCNVGEHKVYVHCVSILEKATADNVWNEMRSQQYRVMELANVKPVY